MEEGSPERPVWSVPVTDENEDTCQKFVIQLTGFVRADELQVQYQRQYLRQAA
jgi:cell division septation protein DedD